MPSLTHTLQGLDFGYLRIIAEILGVELQATSTSQALAELVEKIQDRSLLEEVVADLPDEGRAALEDLLTHGGRLPWSLFIRRYGPVREMGAGRRDREKPHHSLISASEQLWYRALVGRAFFDTPDGPEEFAYIPENLLPLLPKLQINPGDLPGRPASSAERNHPSLASDLILEDACTLLAALRLALPFEAIPLVQARGPLPLTPVALQQLLNSAGLLDVQGQPLPEPTRAFLEASRGEALQQLVRAWLDSSTFNELALLPELGMEGEWDNEPRRARQAVLDLIEALPVGTWWSLNAFIAWMREKTPDFQRPAGDYDSWFIRDQRTGEFLRGFDHWNEVEGALLRFLIGGPLYWMGIVDLASPGKGESPQAFHLSSWAASLLDGKAPKGLPVEDQAIQVRSDSRLRLPLPTPRAIRYQIARFCAWEGFDGEAYRYRLTPASLEKARSQGLRSSHLLGLLRKHSQTLPPALVKAVERWEEQGSQARLERLLVLRLKNPKILQELRASRANRFLGEPLGPTTVIVKPGAAEKVLAALAEMGYLGSCELDQTG
jgi:Helicase conserved C-terminal domain